MTGKKCSEDGKSFLAMLVNTRGLQAPHACNGMCMHKGRRCKGRPLDGGCKVELLAENQMRRKWARLHIRRSGRLKDFLCNAILIETKEVTSPAPTQLRSYTQGESSDLQCHK
jgi:hypothetical protein